MSGAVRTQRPGATRQQLHDGLAHHRAGRLEAAAACYSQVLVAEPGNADAHHLLGLLLLADAHLTEAASHFERVVALRPKVAEHRSNYGHVLRSLGDLDGALRELTTATRLDPGYTDAWINLGLVRLDRGEIALAVDVLETAVIKDPQSPLAQLNLGNALRAAGRLEEAAARYRTAAGIAPELSVAHKNLGVLAQLAGRDDEAVPAYERALATAPNDVDVLTNLGVLYLKQDRVAEAIATQSRAVGVAPQVADGWLNGGTALQAAGRLDEALQYFVRAAALSTGPEPLTAMGSLAAERGDFALAVELHDQALARDAERPDARWNRALALIGRGDIPNGWDEYEWRWQASTRPAEYRAYPWPAYQGEDLAGKRILIWREQGLGDELMFLTCLGDVVQAGAQISVAVSPRLVSLVERAFPTVRVVPDTVVSIVTSGSFDFHLPMGSLPRFWRRSHEAFAGSGTYLRPHPDMAELWVDRLASLPEGPRVGVCWRSGLLTAERQRHYAPLAAWAPVWRVRGVNWINLQYDECEQELAEVERTYGIRVHRWPGDDLKQDLESVVGLLSSLDAVVTAPTAVSSLAGATGVRTWQTDSGNDWTVFGRDRSPWWPTIALRRKGQGGDWGAVLQTVATELTQLVHDEAEGWP